MGSLETWRDFVIVVYGAMGILLFAFLILLTVVVIFAVRKVTRLIDEVSKESVRPALMELKESAHNVRGASEFWADNAVGPLIKVMSAGRGVKRGVSTFSRVARRVRR